MVDPKTYQSEYWGELVELKAQLFYLELHIKRAERVILYVDCGLALIGSAGIGGWAIWKEYSAVWGGMVAGSQVLAIAKRYLPYWERRKQFPKVYTELEALFIESYRRWYEVQNGMLSAQEIHLERMALLKKKSEATRKSDALAVLGTSQKLRSIALLQTREYFSEK